jgi:hypothetical protein
VWTKRVWSKYQRHQKRCSRVSAPPTSKATAPSLPFCLFHHHLVHEGGWTYKIIDADTLHFFPPNGGPRLISKRRPFLQPDLNKRLVPEPTRRVQTPCRT